MNVLELMLWAQRPFPKPPGGSSGPPPGTEEALGIFLAIMGCTWLVMMAMFLVIIVSMWKIFTKAGEPGWASIVPIYNMMVLARIGGRDEIQGLLCLIPVVGIVFAILIWIDVCKRFDKGVGFVIGLLLVPFIFAPMLAFGSARYRGRRKSRAGADDRPRRRRRDEDEEEDEDDRPRRRRRDEEDEDEDDRPRKRGRAEDRFRKSRPDDDDD